MDTVQGNTSSKNKVTHPETQTNQHKDKDLTRQGYDPKSEKETCSPSSSSTSSEEEDFFQLDTSELGTTPMASPHQHVENVQLESEAQFSPDHSGAHQSPPVQVMGKSDATDPNRIPSSIFARTSTNAPMEWSVASNESLFSIHMGNNSFSRDHAILMGRSQELAFPNSPLSGLPPLSPSSTPRPVHFKQAGVPEATNAEAMNDGFRAAAEDHSEKDRPSAEVGPRTSRHSNGSVCSFAFPILTGGERDGSIKVGPEPIFAQSEQPQQPPPTETPKAAPPAAGTRWFSCLSCCPFCH